MKIGCVSWCFHSFAAGTNPEEAIDLIGEIGFDAVDLIALGRADLTEYWNDTTIDRLNKQLERNRLTVAQFVIFQPVVEDLSSTDIAAREVSLDYFEQGCQIAKKLDAPIVNIVAPWARALKGPSDYLPRYYEVRDPKPGQKYHIDIEPGFNWDEVWQAYIDSTKASLERVKANGLKMSIEHHTHCMIPDATAFLRLWDAIQDPALGYNMDTGWTLSQREYPPLAIYKINQHLMNLHVRDIDGMMRQFVPVGEGVMDFAAIIEALKNIGFTGCLSIEQDKHRPEETTEICANYLAIMRKLIE